MGCPPPAPPRGTGCSHCLPAVPREPGKKPVQGGTGLGTPWEVSGGPAGPRPTGLGTRRQAPDRTVVLRAQLQLRESQGHSAQGSGGQGPERDSSHTWGELRLQGGQAAEAVTSASSWDPPRTLRCVDRPRQRGAEGERASYVWRLFAELT